MAPGRWLEGQLNRFTNLTALLASWAPANAVTYPERTNGHMGSAPTVRPALRRRIRTALSRQDMMPRSESGEASPVQEGSSQPNGPVEGGVVQRRPQPP